MNKKFSVKRIIIGVLVGFPLFWIALFVYTIIVDKAPQFFPLDDPEATYTIIKTTAPQNTTEVTNISRLDEATQPGFYHLVYTGKRVQILSGNSFSIIIADSANELAPFINQSVSLTGKFVNSTTKQCIAKKCTQFSSGPWVGFMIQNIKLK